MAGCVERLACAPVARGAVDLDCGDMRVALPSRSAVPWHRSCLVGSVFSFAIKYCESSAQTATIGTASEQAAQVVSNRDERRRRPPGRYLFNLTQYNSDCYVEVNLMKLDITKSMLMEQEEPKISKPYA